MATGDHGMGLSGLGSVDESCWNRYAEEILPELAAYKDVGHEGVSLAVCACVQGIEPAKNSRKRKLRRRNIQSPSICPCLGGVGRKSPGLSRVEDFIRIQTKIQSDFRRLLKEDVRGFARPADRRVILNNWMGS